MIDEDNYMSVDELNYVISLMGFLNRDREKSVTFHCKVRDANGETLGVVTIGETGEYVFYLGGLND